MLNSGQNQAAARSSATGSLPAVWAGPMLRKLGPQCAVWWLAASRPFEVSIELYPESSANRVVRPYVETLKAGACLYYLLIHAHFDDELPEGEWIDYRLCLRAGADDPWLDHTEYAPDICYPGKNRPGFVLARSIQSILHGSCRKPHYQGCDGLVAADRLLSRILSRVDSVDSDESNLPAWPSLLVMTGDQVYVDDVAGPMLAAIHALINKLGVPNELLPSADESGLETAADLYADEKSFYRREDILPRLQGGVLDVLFGGARKPVFTSVNAENHLITLAEILALYLLVWSPVPWIDLDFEMPSTLSDALQERYREEREVIAKFVEGLSSVRRLLAHIPSAMIFDDHDVSDDWNLNRAWESLVYEHPFSRRLVGNAIVGYLINQGWGNDPERFPITLLRMVREALAEPGQDRHDALIDEILQFEGWDFTWETNPPLIVLDTRTRRWRSERRPDKPSGLLDWEAVTDLQHNLRGRNSVLLVSAAPIFGVKLIEAVQKVFSRLGKPLMVDAEYWMGHPGTAAAILNVFSHRKTPENFVVLSGDVHYSFVYDIEFRGNLNPDSDIWQICSSGLKNAFPERLLNFLDVGNRWLYAPRSPLNWFTRRRRMRIVPRKPEGVGRGHRLLNGSGVGVVELDEQGAPWRIRHLLAASDRLVAFEREESHALWE